MTSDAAGQPIHHHSDALPHDETQHLVAAFTLLLFDRGVTTTDELSTRLTQLQVVRGRIEPDGLARTIRGLEVAGLLATRHASARSGDGYELTPAGRAVVEDRVALMRDRRRLTRTFLALYDRSDE